MKDLPTFVDRYWPLMVIILTFALLTLLQGCAELSAARSLAVDAVTVPVKLKYQKQILSLEREVDELQGRLTTAAKKERKKLKKKLAEKKKQLQQLKKSAE